MQDLKVGDYIHVVKRIHGVEEFYATVKEVVRDEETGLFQIAIVRPDGGVPSQRLVFAHNKITLVNLIEANE